MTAEALDARATGLDAKSLPPPGRGAVLAGLHPDLAGCITHVHRRAAVPGDEVPWPGWIDAVLRERLTDCGIRRPWRHQQVAADLAWSGRHVVIGTGTGSGKSLAYLLPTLTGLMTDPDCRVLYLSPTKALGGDQLRAIVELDLPGARPARYDGDTSREDRDWARAHANFLFTNPDMLHRTLLPQHARFRTYFKRLRFVVIDECHTYHGVFGSHVAQVIRRLRRVCERYGASPTFVLTSATTANPAQCASRLVGLPIEAVTVDGSPQGALEFALYEPRVSEHDPAVRRSALSEAADLLADLVRQQARSLAFVRSRPAVEIVAAGARRQLDNSAPGLASRVGSYRAGYLSEERRTIERRLRSGELLGVASTNALELGINVTGLDAVVIAGWPGKVASLWQQAGRAGRAGRPATAIFVARDDPLDSYLTHHPEAMFGRPVEATVIDPSNPYILGPHLECAAAEFPLTTGDLELFPGAAPRIDALVDARRLRRRADGWYWTRHDERPAVDLRGAADQTVALIESATGRLLGHVDGDAAHHAVHDGAVYLHLGESYVVESLDLEASVALVRQDEPPWSTIARTVTDLRIVDVERESLSVVRPAGPRVGFASVDVTTQVVSYLRRRRGTGEVLGETALQLPPRQLRTRAVFVTIPGDVLAAAGLDAGCVPGAAHAAEHAAIGLLPLFVTCDRWDIGGVSTAIHPDTGEATIFVYDGHAGGAGFAEGAYGCATRWLRATRDAIATCGCDGGCPSCVQSPKCGNGNHPLDKAGAVALLTAVLPHLPPADD